MVWTTPIDKRDAHEEWHVFIKGLCIYCGYYCDDCPLGVATCKCTSESRADKILAAENSGLTSFWMD